MIYNLLIFFSYYALILFSILGYGLFFLRLFKIDIRPNNFGYVGIFGIYILIIYSYLSNLFIAHSEFHNLSIILFGIFFFIYLVKNLNFKYKKQIFFVTAVFVVLFCALFQFKNHDDFPYYHFPYMYYLTQQSFYIGIGQFNHGFRTPSSLFYINSLFYLPFAKFYLFNFISIYILGFANIILLSKIHNIFKFSKNKKNQINFINYLSLFSFVFINIFFYRLSEYGTDRAAMILIFIFIVELFSLNNLKKNNKINLFYIYILGAIIISLKAFYILYLIFILPLFFIIFKRNGNYFKTLKLLFYNKYSVLFLILLFFIFLTSFINTGCIIYPISFTCFDNLSWSIPMLEVKQMNEWYELWSKGGATPNFRVENPNEYIKNFNWFGNWINIYFFNKVSDFVLGLILLISIILFLFRKIFFNNKFDSIKSSTYIIYITIFILGLEWLYNHPSLRYGGYHILPLLFFIPLSIKLASSNIDLSKYTKIVFILIFITTSIFIIRNVNRVIKEVKFYDYKPIKETFYKIDKNHFRIQKQMMGLIDEYNGCENITNKCNTKIKIIMGRIIFLNK